MLFLFHENRLVILLTKYLFFYFTLLFHGSTIDMDFDDSHPIVSHSKAYITINVKPHNRVFDTDLHHAPIRNRLKPLAHTIDKNEGTLYHTMEVDGTAKICIRATDTDKVDDHNMVFGLRIMTSEEQPELIRTHGKDKDTTPANVERHLTHVEMELQRISTAMESVLKEADVNQERDTKFHKQTLAMHSATTFWPIVQVCVLLMTGFTQTSHIVHFFKSRRII
jgi:emp24/gp25L/p24 family/GOLD